MPRYPGNEESPVERFVRFMRHVRIGDHPGSCWEWNGDRADGCYGRFSIYCDAVMAHRWMYERVVGPIPDGLLVRHRCDNPSCVNPAHLEVGTQVDNLRDMAERGRRPNRQGEKHPLARLTADDVRAIRLQRKLGTESRALAAKYGISLQHVGKILRRDNWRHI